MQGSTSYLRILGATLKKEMAFSDQGGKGQVGFIDKISKDITGVQTGLRTAAKAERERHEKQKMDT